MPEAKEHWHLSKNVPIGIIVALAIQTVAAAFWVGQLSSRVDRNTETIAEHKTELKEGNSTEPRLVRVETDISYIRKAVDDNKIKLDKVDAKVTELLRGTRTTP